MSLMFVAFWLIAVPLVQGTRHTFRIRTTKSLIGPVGVPFGFNDHGTVTLDVSKFSLDPVDSESSNVDRVEAGFLMQRFKNEAEFYQFMDVLQTNSSACAFEHFQEANDFRYDGDYDGSDDGLLLHDDDSFSEGEIQSAEKGVFLSMKSKDRSIEYQFKKDEAGLYFLIYQVCGQQQDELVSTIELEFHFTNLDNLGNPSYLSSGEMKLPLLFFFFSFSYIMCFGVWVINIREIQKGNDSLFSDSGPRPKIYAIHQIMGALIFVKFLSVFFESLRFYIIKEYGHAEVWSVVFYSVDFIRHIFLFTVVLLIGTGWSFIKPFINEREKKVILSVLILQVLNNIVIAVLSQETAGESNYAKLAGLLHLVDIICCGMILVPIVWQVNELEKSVDGDEDLSEREAELEAGDKGQILSKLKLFRTFYLVVIAYIYSTRILVYLFASLLDYRHLWVRHFVVEIVTLSFYVAVGLMFRPITEIAYRGIEEDDELDEVELLSSKKAKD